MSRFGEFSLFHSLVMNRAPRQIQNPIGNAQIGRSIFYKQPYLGTFPTLPYHVVVPNK
jgi:hypothetical protein